jgi:hypothetical protein
MCWGEDISRVLGMRDEYRLLFEILEKRNHFGEMDLGLKIKYR